MVEFVNYKRDDFVRISTINRPKALNALNRKVLKYLNSTFFKIATFPLPVVATAKGFTLGGGYELTLACNIRLASENAIFAQQEVSLGITSGFGGAQSLSRLAGAGRTKEIVYAGWRMDIENVAQTGLANEVFAPGQLMDGYACLGSRNCSECTDSGP
jgi:enoyl-CoA hydratase